MKPLVMKFGGSSIANADAIRRSASLVTGEINNQDGIVVIVSALSGVTNLLLETCHAAKDKSWNITDQLIQSFYSIHEELLRSIDLNPHELSLTLEIIKKNTDRLMLICTNIHTSGDISLNQKDAIAALGECSSAPIFSALLRSRNITARTVVSTEIIQTDENYTQATILYDATESLIRAKVLPLLSAGIVPVITGYIGAAANGNITTLGRGSSDLSSTIIGAALNAKEVWNWTDVDGVMTADPNIVPDAITIPNISYDEMNLLAASGAKVLHADSTKPISQKGIPLRVRNSFRPENTGTLVLPSILGQKDKPWAVVYMKGEIRSAKKTNKSVHHYFDPMGLEIDPFQSIHNYCVEDFPEKVIKPNNNCSSINNIYMSNIYLVTVLGGTLQSHTLSSILRDHKINIIAIHVNINMSTVSFVVLETDFKRVVNILHASMINPTPDLADARYYSQAWAY